MERAKTPAQVILALCLLAACGGDPETPSSSVGTTSPAEAASPTETTSPAETSSPATTTGPSPTDAGTGAGGGDDGASGEDTDALPPGFPDPRALVGQEAYDLRGPAGWRTVVGGVPLDLPLILGACFPGDTEEVCAYSISASGPARPDGTPQPSEAALLLLLRSTGATADGTPTWEVLDALVAWTPDGETAILEACDGEPGVAFYPAGDPGNAATIPVARAWGADDGVSALVELDADDVTCAATHP